MNTLQDILTYIRRIIKTPSNAVITDELLIDYINRFWLMDVDARIQVFDLKTTYQFQTTPGFDQYNMPLYSVQTETTNPTQTISMFPVYQGFMGPCYVNGVEMPFNTQREYFFNVWPNYNLTQVQVGTGDGTTGPYTLTFPLLPSTLPTPTPFPLYSVILRGHVDMSGIIAIGTVNQDPPLDVAGNGASIPLVPTSNVFSQVYFTSQGNDGSNIIVQDSGIFLAGNLNYGLLMNPGKAPNGNLPLVDGGGLGSIYTTAQNTINYFTGVATNVYFPSAIPAGMPINGQCVYYQTGIPRSCLFYDNTLTLRAPPDKQYKIEIDAYLTPAAFLSSTTAIPFGYMAEYIARGAARKIMSDTGDWEQFNAYEPLFKEQESLVHVRAQRQWTATRSQNIYSATGFQGSYNQSSFGV